MKTNINKLNYYELLEFAKNSEILSDDEKENIVLKLLDLKKYNDYYIYIKDIKWLTLSDKVEFVKSIIKSNLIDIIYDFSVKTKKDLTNYEVDLLLDYFIAKHSYENYLYLFIINFDKIINYSLLIDLWNKYQNYLSDYSNMIVKTISESSSAYYMFKLLCDNISSDNKSLLIKSICNMDDISYICDTIKFMNSNLSSDDIKNILSSYERTLNFIIVKSLLQNNISLNEENINLIIDCIFKEVNKENIIYFTSNMYDFLTNKQAEKIIDLAIKTNDSEIIYNVSEILKDKLDKENVSKVSNAMQKQENIYYIYEFLYTFKDKLSKEDKNKLVSKVLNSKEMKLIILVAVFIDVKLIEKLFKSKKELFIFAVAINLFTIDELNKLRKELGIKEEKPKIKNIPKKYKLKRKDK